MNATVTWNANTEPDLAGYLVYHGIASLIYDPGITVLAPTTTYLFTGLEVGILHYFNVKAFDTSGNVSAFGGEVTKFEPIPVYAQSVAMHGFVSSRQMRETDTSNMVSGFIAEVLGLNVVIPPPPPILERVPIGGFMIV